MSGNVLSSQSAIFGGDYQESAIVNGYPSWINANHAIWFVTKYKNWAVGKIEDLGTTLRYLATSNYINAVYNPVTEKEPFDIDSRSWSFWEGGYVWTYTEAGDISITCSQAKGKNNYINMYSG